jgi:hypothetical protein
MIMATAVLGFAGLFLFLASFKLYLFHYSVDFFVPWSLVVVLGWWTLLERAQRGWLRRGLTLVGMAATFANAVMGVLITLSFVDVHARTPGIARAVNQIVAWTEQWRGVDYGPVEIEFTTPLSLAPRRQPILTTGLHGEDVCFLVRESADEFRIAFFHAGAGGPISRVLKTSPGRRHHLEISTGGLFPAPSHPFFRGFDSREIEIVRSSLLVKLDGETVLHTRANFYESSPSNVWLGRNPHLPDVSASEFTGSLTAKHRMTLRPGTLPKLPGQGSGPVRITLRPPDARNENFLPLVCTGQNGAGDILAIQYLPDGSARFMHDHWGGPTFYSAPVHLPEREAVFHIEMGSLCATDGPAVAPGARQRLAVRLGPDLLFATERPFHPARTDQVSFGINDIGGGSTIGMFTGTIYSVERVP